MTDEQAIEYQAKAEKLLDNIRGSSKRILSKRLKIQALKESTGASAIRYDKDKIVTTPSNFIELALAEAMDLEKEIEEDLAQEDESKVIAYRIINKLDNLDEQNVLLFYYIDGYKADECMAKMSISERTFYYTRDKALSNFGSFL